MLRFALPLSFAFAFSSIPALAHELWIEPLRYQVDSEATIEANLVNGQEFGGTRIAFFPQRTAAFDYFLNDQRQAVTARLGASPAVSVPPLGDGLHVISYISTPSTIDYDEWDRFQRFVDHKDLGDISQMHHDRGLPDADFTEVYTRFSKSLVGVGDSNGSDHRIGLETELVALANPYTDELQGFIPVQLFYQFEVRANAQIELFEKDPDGEVTITLHRTNAEGIAMLPIQPGYSYMADAVVMREPAQDFAAEHDAVWETLWANLTFFVPE